jgi:hypothetical protein
LGHFYQGNNKGFSLIENKFWIMKN